HQQRRHWHRVLRRGVGTDLFVGGPVTRGARRRARGAGSGTTGRRVAPHRSVAGSAPAQPRDLAGVRRAPHHHVPARRTRPRSVDHRRTLVPTVTRRGRRSARGTGHRARPARDSRAVVPARAETARAVPTHLTYNLFFDFADFVCFVSVGVSGSAGSGPSISGSPAAAGGSGSKSSSSSPTGSSLASATSAT